MATYTGTQRLRAKHESSEYGNVWADTNAVDIATAVTTSDVIIALEVPAGLRLQTLRYRVGDMDTSGSPTLTMNIGWRYKDGSSQSLTAFASASTAFQSAQASWVELVFNTVKFEKPAEIVFIPAASAAAMSSAVTLHTHGTGALVGTL